MVFIYLFYSQYNRDHKNVNSIYWKPFMKTVLTVIYFKNEINDNHETVALEMSKLRNRESFRNSLLFC